MKLKVRLYMDEKMNPETKENATLKVTGTVDISDKLFNAFCRCNYETHGDSSVYGQMFINTFSNGFTGITSDKVVNAKLSLKRNMRLYVNPTEFLHAITEYSNAPISPLLEGEDSENEE